MEDGITSSRRPRARTR